jgi:hypothetical protein
MPRKRDDEQTEGGAVQGPGELVQASGEGQVPQGAEDLQRVPVHPPVPDLEGSSPHPNPLPVGAMGEDVRHETNDIDADGTPVTSQGFVEGDPDIDGESDRRYSEIDRAFWQHGPAEQVGPVGEDGQLEPVINMHSEEGARLDEIKLQRPVRYVPNAFTLDPQSGNAKEDLPQPRKDRLATGAPKVAEPV